MINVVSSVRYRKPMNYMIRYRTVEKKRVSAFDLGKEKESGYIKSRKCSFSTRRALSFNL